MRIPGAPCQLAHCKSGVMHPDYLCGEPTQRLDRIVAYVMIIVKIVGNVTNGFSPQNNRLMCNEK
jgi:hypothetical protein